MTPTEQSISRPNALLLRGHSAEWDVTAARRPGACASCANLTGRRFTFTAPGIERPSRAVFMCFGCAIDKLFREALGGYPL